MRKTMIIAEIGINHNGDLALAKKLMLAAKQAGCDAVKFQKRDIDTVYSPKEQATLRESPWGTTTGEQKRGLELSREDYDAIDEYSQDLLLPWFASCWDVKSLEFLDKYRLPLVKIASPMVTHPPFLAAVASRGIPVIISTGMSTVANIDNAVITMVLASCPIHSLLYCVSEYPCAVEKLQLKAGIKILQDRYPDIPIGYSGHEVGLAPTLAAVAMGAKVVERHITMDRSMYGSDQSASVEPGGFKRLVEEIREVELALGTGEIRNKPYPEEMKNAAKLRYFA